jgi:hypothetical protein
MATRPHEETVTMRHTIGTVGAMAVIAATLAGCGGSSGVASPKRATTTATTTTAASATADPVVARQQAYFLIAGPVNKAQDDLTASWGPNWTKDQIVEFATEFAPLEEQEAKALHDYKGWGDARDEIDALAAADAADARILHGIAHNGFSHAEWAKHQAYDTGKASAVRLALGLPISRG